MPNGKQGLFETFYEKAMDVAQRVGPVFGFLMGLCYAVGYGFSWFKGGDKGDFLQMCFGLGFGFLAAGLGRGQKKAAEVYIANEAQKRIEDPEKPNISEVPAINEEMKKQMSDGPTVNLKPKE